MARPSVKNPINSPTQSRGQATFDAILTATTYFLMKQGLADFSSNDIAEKAGVNINSFYQYFLNREAAILEVTNRFLARDESTFSDFLTVAARKKSTREGFRFILDQTLKLMNQDVQLRRQILVNLSTIIGPSRLRANRRIYASQLIDFIPADKFPTHEKRAMAAQVVVHTFLSVLLSFMDGAVERTEKQAIENEVIELIMGYI